MRVRFALNAATAAVFLVGVTIHWTGWVGAILLFLLFVAIDVLADEVGQVVEEYIRITREERRNRS